MKITRIIEKPLKLQSNISNAFVNFAHHTVSLVAVVTDRMVGGKPLTGISFNSIGRYAQGGILKDRMIPRILNAASDSLLQDCGTLLCPEKVSRAALKDEKPGGHGDRAHALGGLELAIWDLNAKINDEPACQTIARHYGRPAPSGGVEVYAAGGYYYPGEDMVALKAELAGYAQQGFTRFKMKIGGASLDEDLRRIDAALEVAARGERLAVDANGRFDITLALEYAKALRPYKLMWFEEAGDPLDFELNSLLAEAYDGALATGENLFSSMDVKNLVLFGGTRPGLDIFQMDSGLSYGITEYARMLHEMESRGFSRSQAFPHGGQLLALHVVAGLGLGGCEVYPSIFQPLGGFADDASIVDGKVCVGDAPGFGLEAKSALIREYAELIC